MVHPTLKFNSYALRHLAAHLCELQQFEQAVDWVTREDVFIEKMKLFASLDEALGELFLVRQACFDSGNSLLAERVARCATEFRSQRGQTYSDRQSIDAGSDTYSEPTLTAKPVWRDSMYFSRDNCVGAGDDLFAVLPSLGESLTAKNESLDLTFDNPVDTTGLDIVFDVPTPPHYSSLTIGNTNGDTRFSQIVIPGPGFQLVTFASASIANLVYGELDRSFNFDTREFAGQAVSIQASEGILRSPGLGHPGGYRFDGGLYDQLSSIAGNDKHIALDILDAAQSRLFLKTEVFEFDENVQTASSAVKGSGIDSVPSLVVNFTPALPPARIIASARSSVVASNSAFLISGGSLAAGSISTIDKLDTKSTITPSDRVLAACSTLSVTKGTWSEVIISGNLSIPSLDASNNQPQLMTWTIHNSGTRAGNVSSWLDRLVLSTDEILGNADDVSLGRTFIVSSSIIVGGNVELTTNILELPASVPLRLVINGALSIGKSCYRASIGFEHLETRSNLANLAQPDDYWDDPSKMHIDTMYQNKNARPLELTAISKEAIFSASNEYAKKSAKRLLHFATPEELLKQLGLYDLRRDTEEAITFLVDVLTIFPDEFVFYLQLANLLCSCGYWNKFYEVLDRAKQAPFTPVQHAELATLETQEVVRYWHDLPSPIAPDQLSAIRAKLNEFERRFDAKPQFLLIKCLFLESNIRHLRQMQHDAETMACEDQKSSDFRATTERLVADFHATCNAYFSTSDWERTAEMDAAMRRADDQFK